MRQAAFASSILFGASIFVLGVAAAFKVIDFRTDARSTRDLVQGKSALAFESHYNKEFPARDLGVSLWAAIAYVLFKEGRPGIAIGGNDWLYTDEELKTYADAEVQTQTHLALMLWVREELARRGSALAVAVVPSKARVYPEHLGGHRPASIHRDLYERIQAELATGEMPQIDLLGALTAAKGQQQTFLRTDTHWTHGGAQVAAREIARALKAAGLAGSGSTAYRTQTQSEQPHKGDLFNFLPLDPYFSALLPPQEQIAVQRTEAAGAGEVDLLGDGAEPAIALTGTSYSADARWNFTGALQESLREDVVNYAVEGKGPFVAMLEYLSRKDLPQTAPRVVVWEVPERFFPVAYDFSPYAALLPPELVQQETVSKKKNAHGAH